MNLIAPWKTCAAFLTSICSTSGPSLVGPIQHSELRRHTRPFCLPLVRLWWGLSSIQNCADKRVHFVYQSACKAKEWSTIPFPTFADDIPLTLKAMPHIVVSINGEPYIHPDILQIPAVGSTMGTLQKYNP